MAFGNGHDYLRYVIDYITYREGMLARRMWQMALRVKQRVDLPRHRARLSDPQFSAAEMIAPGVFYSHTARFLFLGILSSFLYTV